jgi:predicted RNase H-like nuclease (RuvC/YqgF family)
MEEQVWTSQEIKDLISYAKEMQHQNETLRAQLIAMNAKLNNEEAKNKKLLITINYLTNNYDY